MEYNYAILTLSDKGAKGEREDKSGKEIEKIMTGELGYKNAYYKIIPDEKDILLNEFKYCVETLKLDLVLTTGGTGLSPRDITPETTLSYIDKEIPGMSEEMRRRSTEITPHGMLSRAVVGLKNSTLIINLPGSPKAVRENLQFIKAAIPHAIGIIKRTITECGSE